MISKFLWYSKNSKETGTKLAEALGFGESHGTLLPRNFNGVAVCWGASPGPDFKWNLRNLQGCFNDPRKVRNFTDRKVMFDTLMEAGVNVVSCVPLTNEAQYSNICNILAATEAEGFTVTKVSGSGAQCVTDQESLIAAVAAGYVRALDNKFVSTTRIRVFVANGTILGSIKLMASGEDALYAERTAGALLGGWADTAHTQAAVQEILQRLLSKELVKPGKSYWAPYSLTSKAKKQVAITTAATLGFDFCAIDMEDGNKSHDVINVVTTPDLVNTTEIMAPLVNTITTWVTTNSMSPKEILQALINDSTDDEASALLDELRSIKVGLSAAAVQG